MAEKKRDLLTIGYDNTSKAFRHSLFGKLVKHTITNDFTKTQRDKLLNRFPEHYKRFAQYLTGGTVGNEDITWLPDHIKKEIIQAHHENRYPERNKSPVLQEDGFYGKKGDPNPTYNPNSNLLNLYKTSPETAHSLGHVRFTPDEKGGYTLTDTWDVDHSTKPFSGFNIDLVEGAEPAAFAYDLSKWLGINRDMHYNVKFDPNELKINK